MATVDVQYNYVFGLRRGVTNDLCFLDEHTVLFPSGNNCVRYHLDHKWQKFVPGTEKSQAVHALALSPDRRYLAVSERADRDRDRHRPTVTVYDLSHEQGRKRKLLTAGGGGEGELAAAVGDFVSVAFSPDSRYLAGQSGGPSWTLVLWLWEKQRVMASLSSSHDGHPITQVSFNPQDSAQLCVSGVGLLRIYHYGNGALKRLHAAKVDGVGTLLCHAWTSGTRVVAGTDSGRLLMVESGERCVEVDTRPPPETRNAESKQPTDEALGPTPGPAPAPGPAHSITSIVAFSKGFMCSTGPGTVCVFENTEEKENYRKTREILIPADPCSSEPGQAQQQTVATLCLSPNEETLALSTQQGQLYTYSLAYGDTSSGEPEYFGFLSSSFHSKPITGLSVCVRKPLVATCSLDRSVRLWNYDTNVLELYKEFPEEALSVSLHPSGLFLLVAFSDKLRMMTLLIDDIRGFKEFSVRGCRECVFSHGGHLFAAINGNVVHVYSTTTFDNVLTLKGHHRKVQAVAWSADDSSLVSCGTDGAVYEWNALSGARLSENVLKSCVYAGVALSPDGRTIFAVGGASLKEIQDSQVLREVPGDDVTYTALVLSRSGKVVFAGTSGGTVRVIKNPLPLQRDWLEYQGHCAPVTKMQVTFDDQYLLTVSGDGALLVWRIVYKDGRGLRDKEVCHTLEVLITKSDLEEKNQNMQDLKIRVEELKMEKEYQLRLSEISHNQMIKDLSAISSRDIEALKTNNQVLEQELERERQPEVRQKPLLEMSKKHSKELQDLESSNSQKLLLEYAKQAELQQQSAARQQDYELRLEALQQSGARSLEELSRTARTELQQQTQQLQQCQAEAQQQRREAEEELRQVEEDADQESHALRLTYEGRLHGEKEANLTLKGESGVMRKQLGSLQRELDERCGDVERLQRETTRLQGVIRSLEGDIAGLKKDIAEHVDTIHDKEKVILEHGKKNQELHILKFLLENQLEDYKRNMAPRDEAVSTMKSQIQEMDVELECLRQRNTRLELGMADLHLKLTSSSKEKNKETQRAMQVEATVRRFQVDLHRCAALLQEPKQLKRSVRDMYGRYVRPGDVVEIASVDADLQSDCAWQQDHLDKTVSTLKAQLTKDSELHSHKRAKLMRENVSLIQEINELRQELRTTKTQLHDHQAQSAAAARHKPNRRSPAAESRSAESSGRVARPRPEEQEEKEEAQRIIQMQRSQIQQLRQELLVLESASTPAPAPTPTSASTFTTITRLPALHS